MEIKHTDDAKTTHIKVLVHGVAGAGKTRLCATTGGNPIILSAEAGLLSLHQENLPYIEIKTMKNLQEAITFLQTDKIYDWVCVDSLSEIVAICFAEDYKAKADKRQAYAETRQKVMRAIRDLRALPKHLYFSCQQGASEVVGKIIPMTNDKEITQNIPYIFDEVFVLREMTHDGKTFKVLQTFEDSQYVAKDRSGTLATYEPAKLSKIAAKILTNKPKGQ